MPFETFNFDFVISYAGEDRATAEKLYALLKEGHARVFFAPEYQPAMWGDSFYRYLADMYSNRARFCILPISRSYLRDMWTSPEWKSAQERALTDVDKTYILPIRLDDSPVPGLLGGADSLDLRESSIEEVVAQVLKKMVDARRPEPPRQFDAPRKFNAPRSPRQNGRPRRNKRSRNKSR